MNINMVMDINMGNVYMLFVNVNYYYDTCNWKNMKAMGSILLCSYVPQILYKVALHLKLKIELKTYPNSTMDNLTPCVAST